MIPRLILLLIQLTITSAAIAQNTFIQENRLNGILPIDEKGQVIYESIIERPDLKRDELFKRARRWFAQSYNSANAVLQVNDPSTGELVGKGLFMISEPSPMGIKHLAPVKYTLSVDVREGKYRVRLSNLILEEKLGTAPIEQLPYVGKKWVTAFYARINDESTALLSALSKAVDVADEF